MTRRRALVCAPVVPGADRESGSKRVYDWIELLREEGWIVTFVARRAAAGDRPYADALRRAGVPTYTGFEHLEHLLAATSFDLALVSFWYAAEECIPAIRVRSPRTRIVVDSMDLHFLRHARRAFVDGRADGAALDGEYGSHTARELNVYAAADAVMAVSPKEAELVNDLVAQDDLAFCVPDCDEIARSSLPFCERRGLIYVGNFRHPPNAGAVRFLLRQIVPRIDERLRAEHPLYVVGNALDESIKREGERVDHVRLVGWVPAVVPYLHAARVSVVPLLYGAGTKRKLIQALMAGTPTVSTRVGVEGLSLAPEAHLLVRDDPDSFAAAVESLLVDEALWARVSHAGRRRVLRLHDRRVVAARLSAVLDEVVARTPKPATIATANLRLHRPDLDASAPWANDCYRAVVEGVRETVRRRVPARATIVVASKGDAELIRHDGVHGWHFPRDRAGGYAGFHPADGEAAVAQLEALRSQGARYLLVPSTAFWWLDYYAELRTYLERRCKAVARNAWCALYGLPGGSARRNRGRKARA